ncbi:hypothetical protein J6590_036422 [Homalodisca vitripennis]|nr:hypothetical protein J6590_036422 [Homalodisca vitripennis]
MDSEALLKLYILLVRPLLGYCCVMKRPFQFGHIGRIDKIKRRFIRTMCSKLGYAYIGIPILICKLEETLNSPLSIIAPHDTSNKRNVEDLQSFNIYNMHDDMEN